MENIFLWFVAKTSQQFFFSTCLLVYVRLLMLFPTLWLMNPYPILHSSIYCELLVDDHMCYVVN